MNPSDIANNNQPYVCRSDKNWIFFPHDCDKITKLTNEWKLYILYMYRNGWTNANSEQNEWIVVNGLECEIIHGQFTCLWFGHKNVQLSMRWKRTNNNSCKLQIYIIGSCMQSKQWKKQTKTLLKKRNISDKNHFTYFSHSLPHSRNSIKAIEMLRIFIAFSGYSFVILC